MNDKIQIKSMSSLEKCFLDETLDMKEEMKEFISLRNQPVTYQVGVYCSESFGKTINERVTVKLSGELSKYATVRAVISVPNHFPCLPGADSNYLRRTPGLYPDLLRPLHYDNGLTVFPGHLHTLWVEIEALPESVRAGKYPLSLLLLSKENGEVLAENTVTVELLDIELPPQKLIHSEWFYTDCIANHYGVRAFSEKHWKLIEKFIKTAVKNGVNMLLTPIFTPEIDTFVGGERLTTQLIDIEVVGDGEYKFGFDKLDRWIDMAQRLGILYFEIPHFFTQWGATAAPKFVATVNGKKKKIFGWHTDARGEEYKNFLGQMIPALVAYLEKRGIAENTYFHISDEPRLNHLEQYLRCKESVEPHLKNYPIIDALSNYEFYESGVVKKPVPYIPHIQKFLENKVEGLWTYYCGDCGKDGTSRMLAMPLSRTRILGVQLWLHNIEGFLHWGYNFYNNENSYDRLDPFLHTDGEYFAPSGDMFLVYPGDDGNPWESIRLNAMREAMEDIRLLNLCESYIGREETEKILLLEAGGTLTFSVYPKDTNFLYRLRSKLVSAIASAK